MTHPLDLPLELCDPESPRTTLLSAAEDAKLTSNLNDRYGLSLTSVTQ